MPAIDHAQVRPLSSIHLDGAVILPNRIAQLDLIPKNGVCVELGTFKGDFAALILQKCQPKKLYLVDIDCQHVRTRFAAEIDSGIVVCLEGRTSDMVSSVPNDIDYLYVDADHSRAGVTQDLHLYTPKVKSSGFVGLNDYTLFDWVQGVEYGVKHAVHDLCLDHNWKWVAYCLASCDFRDVLITRF